MSPDERIDWCEDAIKHLRELFSESQRETQMLRNELVKHAIVMKDYADRKEQDGTDGTD